jgi:hypothetical protein
MTFVVLWWDYYSWMLFCNPSVWEMMSNGIYFFCLTFYGLCTCLLKTIKFWKDITIFILTWAPWCYALPMMKILIEIGFVEFQFDKIEFKFKFSWREMGCKLMQKKLKFFLSFSSFVIMMLEKKKLWKNTDPKRHIFIPFRVDLKPESILAGWNSRRA